MTLRNKAGIRLPLVLPFTLIAASIASAGVSDAARSADYTILLARQQAIPPTGIDPEFLATPATAGDRHLIVQFHRIPTEREIRQLERGGVTLLDYIPNFAYFANVDPDGLEFMAVREDFRSALSYRPDQKFPSPMKNGNVSAHARNSDGTARIFVQFFRDTNAGDAIALAEQYGHGVEFHAVDRMAAMSIEPARIEELAAADPVQWIDEAPPAARDLLDDVRAAVNADSVQAAPYNLSGAGAVLGMWEMASPAVTHGDFAGRLTVADPIATGSHATSVAGCMAGDGSGSEAWGGTPFQWRGISTAAEIVSFEYPSSPQGLKQSLEGAIANYGVTIANNSWGWYICGGSCSLYGKYDAYSRHYDLAVRGARGAPMSIVFGAGNEQDCPECADSLDHYPYGTVPGPGPTAKNTIAVGAVNAPDKSMTTFSSWGPVDDGRVKPDIVAPGCKVGAGVYTPLPPNDYGDATCGTSFSGPIVTGTLGLLKEQFDLLGYSAVAPHTYKAILIETAEDLGNPGPDYQFGHGHLDIRKAVDLVIANYPRDEMIRVDSLADSEADTFQMAVAPGTASFRIALVWDDFNGTAAALKQLINDLDVRALSPSGTPYYPYLLDPDQPAAAAGTGFNDIDNVEVIEVASPEAGVWNVEVRGALVPEAPQSYTLTLPFESPSTGVAVSEPGPPAARLLAVLPNPFNPTARILFHLPEAGSIRLAVYDVRGRLVAGVAEGRHPAGTIEKTWNGRDDAGRDAPSGIYFARLETAGYSAIRKMVLVR